MAESLDKTKATRQTPFTLMHVCGSHEDTLMKHGLRYLFDTILDNRIRLVAGPGCPVCVSPVEDTDLAVAISKLPNVVVTSYGDMVRVPGSSSSLERERQKGAQVLTVYSVTDAVKMAREKPDKEVVFISPGFETTAPATAIELTNKPPENFSVLSSHRLVPPALEVLANLPDVNLSGMVLPGHVSVIIGRDAYKPFVDKYKVPSAIAGFEPLDMLLGVASVVDQLVSGEAQVANMYGRAVTDEGNQKALAVLSKAFKVVDATWRGLGVFEKSGMELSDEFAQYNARLRFEVEVEPTKEIPDGCSCHEVVVGKIEPEDCPLFMSVCKPENPIGPCMVGLEGTCRIRAVYGD